MREALIAFFILGLWFLATMVAVHNMVPAHDLPNFMRILAALLH